MLLLLDQLGGIWEITTRVTLPETTPNCCEEELLTWPFAIHRWSGGEADPVRIEGVRGIKSPQLHSNLQVSALTCGYVGLHWSVLSDSGSAGVRFWEPILRSPALCRPRVA